jgi:putative transposase
LKATSLDKEIKTQIYQMSLWHRKFADLLNIVVIVKTSLAPNKTAHAVLFTSDLDLGYELLIDIIGCVSNWSSILETRNNIGVSKTS